MTKLYAKLESICAKSGIPGLACAITAKEMYGTIMPVDLSQLDGADKVSRERSLIWLALRSTHNSPIVSKAD